MKINPRDPWSREGSTKNVASVLHDHPSGDLLGSKSFAKEAGDPGDHPSQVRLHLLVGEEEQVLLVPVLPVGEDMLQEWGVVACHAWD